jgi:hypothetical protein
MNTNETRGNIIVTWILLLMMLLVYPTGNRAYYSVPSQVLSVSTYNSSANIDTYTNTTLGDSQQPISNPPPGVNPTAISSILVKVYGGVNDVDGGQGLLFYEFPQPTNPTGVTSSAPKTQPCDSTSCSSFTQNGVAGPITVQFTTSTPVSQYRIIPTDIVVPYAYLDMDAKFLTCSTAGQNYCSSTSSSFFSDVAKNYLLNPFLYGAAKNSDPTLTCRGTNNGKLGASTPFLDSDPYLGYSSNPGCWGCSIPMNTGYPGAPPLYYTGTSKYCLPQKVPGVKIVNSGALNASKYNYPVSDMTAVMDYYYWCFGLELGTQSWNYNQLDYKGAWAPGDKNGDYPGQFVDMWEEWGHAYQCSISIGQGVPTKCAPYAKVNDYQSDIACNYGTYGSSSHTTKDYESGDAYSSNPACNVSNTLQVLEAVRMLTMSCDGVDTGESSYADVTANTGNTIGGFTCPGSYYSFIKPARLEKPFSLARCAAGCSSHSEVTLLNEQTDGNKNKKAKNIEVQTIVRQKGSVEMGPVMCNVYRITPTPKVNMTINVIITAPDGEQGVGVMGTDGGMSFTIVEMQSANFSVRINKIDEIDGGVAAGYNLNGYIVVCGTEQPLPDCGNYPDNGYNINTNPDENTRKIQGVFPGQDPNLNPWPDLMARASSDLQSQCHSTASYTASQNCTSDYYQSQLESCAVPTPRYLSIINWNKQVFWYYVPESQMLSYGSSCGKMGYRNDELNDNAGASFACQQGDFTCTPGFGSPRFGSQGAGTSVLSPCQELGKQTKFNMGTAGTQCVGVNNVPLNLPPGWAYGGTNPDDASQLSAQPIEGAVPNMWLHESTLYRQATDSQSSVMGVEVEIFTNSYYGGEFVSYSPGSLNQTNLEYCASTVNEGQSGGFSVLVCNTGKTPGSYAAQSICSSPGVSSTQNNSANPADTDNPPPQYSVDVSGAYLPIGLAGQQCGWLTWTIDVYGPFSVGSVSCTTTLYPGSDGGAITTFPLSQIHFSCNVSVPEFINTGRNSVFTEYLVPGCESGDLFCWLSTKNHIFQWLVYTMFFIVYAVIILVAIIVLRTVQKIYETDRISQKIANLYKTASKVKRENAKNDVRAAVKEELQDIKKMLESRAAFPTNE